MSLPTPADAWPGPDLLDAFIPRFHVTAPVNWLNDPNGLAYVNGRYHLFYQYNPDAPRWGRPQWGHVSSADLVHWRQHDVALQPEDGGPDRDGCWSGCLRVIDGGPRIYYTGIIENAAGRAESICLAHGSPDLSTWQRDPANPLVAGPPAALGSSYHRDPFLWQDDNGWHLLVASGQLTPEEHGCVAVYHSADARSWTYDGLFADGPRRTGGIDLGRHWECPQLLTIGQTAVLLISAQDPDAERPLMHTAYALGTIDNYRFRPRTWGLLDHGDAFYAATSGHDTDGSPLTVGWVQERLPDREQSRLRKAGALSLPRALRITGDELHTAPARQVSGLLATSRDPQGRPGQLGAQFRLLASVGTHGYPEQVTLRSPDSGTAAVSVSTSGLTLHVTDRDHQAARTLRASFTRAPVPGTPMEVYGDGSLIEVFCAGRAITTRWYRDPRRTEVADLGEDGTAFGRLQAWTVGDQAITSQAEGE
jgi:beta-fructofuranosidase